MKCALERRPERHMAIHGVRNRGKVVVSDRVPAEVRAGDSARYRAVAALGCLDANAEEAWREEIYRRLQQIDSGAVKLIPWDDAQRRLWARRH